jgi:hypothetical protein
MQHGYARPISASHADYIWGDAANLLGEIYREKNVFEARHVGLLRVTSFLYIEPCKSLTSKQVMDREGVLFMPWQLRMSVFAGSG